MNSTQSLLPRLLPPVTALGAAALLALAGLNTFNIYTAVQEPTQDEGITLRSQNRSQAPSGAVDLEQIPKWHLFGKEPQKSKAPPPPKEIIEAPETPLELTLQGTFLGKSKTEDSWAIISSSNNEQKMYRVGDEIPGGAILFAVTPFQVILERNKRHESLSLPRPSMDDEPQEPISSKPQPRSRRSSFNSRRNTAAPAHPPNDRRSEKQALIDEMARIRNKFGR